MRSNNLYNLLRFKEFLVTINNIDRFILKAKEICFALKFWNSRNYSLPSGFIRMA